VVDRPRSQKASREGRAVFVDRDGVINELVPDPVSGRPESPLRVDEVRLIPGAASALRALAQDGWRLVGVSNQPSAAKGLVTLAGLDAIQTRVVELLDAEGAGFDDFRLCLHHPEGVVPELTGACDCRKPAPGMLLAAAAELAIDLGRSWMVGDTDGDVQAGRAAGCRTILVAHPHSAHKRTAQPHPDAVVRDLRAAAGIILAMKGVH
jgi:D-glycero-D-manno-heptose 1,7-bisphosphate phosphatase